MIIAYDFEQTLMSEIDSVLRRVSLPRINLGGVDGASGGGGNPPGGFIGKLSQRNVTFDTTESTNPTIPPSGYSLVTNLNRIRAGVALGDGIILQRHLSSGIIFTSASTVDVENDTTLYNDISQIKFTGAELQLTSSGHLTVTLRESLIASGYKSRSWFIGGAVATNVQNPDRIYRFNDPFTPKSIILTCEDPGDGLLEIKFIKSTDGETWTPFASGVILSGIHKSTTALIAVPAIHDGTLVGFKVNQAPVYPTKPFTNLNILLEGIEMSLGGGSGGGGSLPDFTPKRIPFADNITGVLTESEGFNLIQSGNGNALIIGADHFAPLGGDPEKVGLFVVRDNRDGGFVAETYSDTLTPNFTTLRARGSLASPAAVVTNDVIFRFGGRGYHPSGWASASRFKLEGRVIEDWTPTAQGTKAVISVTPVGTTTTSDVLTVDGTGMLVDGNINATSKLVGTNLQINTGTVNVDDVWVATDTDGNGQWSVNNLLEKTYGITDYTHPIAVGSWTDVNTALNIDVNLTRDCIHFKRFAEISSDEWRGWARPIAASNRASAVFNAYSTYSNSFIGLFAYNSSTTVIRAFPVGTVNGSIYKIDWSDPSTISSGPTAVLNNSNYFNVFPVFFRISIDVTNLYLEISVDGLFWETLVTDALSGATFDYFGVGTYTTTNNIIGNLFHWSED